MPFHICARTIPGPVVLFALSLTVAPAWAQATDLPSSSSAQPRAVRPKPPAAAAPPTERDADAAALAKRLPLDPAIGDLRDTLPPDIPAAMRQLGLRPTEGVRTDLRGHSLTTEEIVNALAH